MLETIRINGADLVVEHTGPTGAPLLLAHHGAPGLSSHSEPRRAFGKLDQWFRVVTHDARGSGESSWEGPYTHEQWTADVDALREHFGADQLIMAGGSYGGFLSLEYALAYPERIRALILRDTAARSYDEEAKQNALKRAEEFPWLTPELVERALGGSFRDNDEFRELFGAIQPLYDVNWDPVAGAERLKNLKLNHLADNYAFSHNLPNYDIRNRLSEIRVPVLITVGRHDWITPVEASEELHALLPDSELVIFENSGHSPQIEEHDAWFAAVLSFLERRGLLPA